MGVMRFLVIPAKTLQEWPEATSAYVTGLDGRVFPTRVEFDGQTLSCIRPASDSGKLHISWPVTGIGRLVLTTASLPERDEPYLLLLELARGKIGELREQSFQWQFVGMRIPQEFFTLLKQAFKLFSRASSIRTQPEEASRVAEQALQVACRASEILGNAYTQQRLQVAAASSAHPPALLGCTLDESVIEPQFGELFAQSFSAAAAPVEWKSIEPEEGRYRWETLDQMIHHCTRNRLLVRGGPLIDLSPHGLPSWLAPWSDDFLSLQSFVCDFIETAVSRYAGQIRIWEVAARGNTGGVLSLSEEQRLQLVARSLEAAQRTDTDAQLFIRVDRPWGEYQSAGDHRLTPFQFVDALVRSSLGISGVNLEIAVGYDRFGTRPRDLLACSRLIDLWSLLGVQIHVTLAFPSSGADDPLAEPAISVGKPPRDGDWDESAQEDWVQRFVSLLMAKPHVTGVFWATFHEGYPHRFPNSGLLRTDGHPKPALRVLNALRHFRGTSRAAPSGGPEDTWVEDH